MFRFGRDDSLANAFMTAKDIRFGLIMGLLQNAAWLLVCTFCKMDAITTWGKVFVVALLFVVGFLVRIVYCKFKHTGDGINCLVVIGCI